MNNFSVSSSRAGSSGRHCGRFKRLKPVKLLLFDILARGLGLGFLVLFGQYVRAPPLTNRLFRGCCVKRERSEGKKAQPKPSISLERLLARATSPSCPLKHRKDLPLFAALSKSTALCASPLVRSFVKGLVCEFSHRCKPSDVENIEFRLQQTLFALGLAIFGKSVCVLGVCF